MKILLADDHPTVREGMKLLLNRLYEGAEIIEARDYPEALNIVNTNEDLSLVLLDRSMPGMDSHGGLQALHQGAEDTPIVILSASEEPAHVWQSLDNGARGYIPKTCGTEVMMHAIQLVMSGGTYVPPTVLEQPSAGVSATVGDQAVNAESGDRNIKQRLGLTQRQVEVLALLVQGKTNKKIALELKISDATVRTHVNAIFKMLNVTNRTEAVHVATGLGFSAD